MAEWESAAEEEGAGGSCMGGCAKLLMVFVLINATVLLLFIMAGVVVYLNWEKLGPPLIEKAEEKLVSLPIVEEIAEKMGFSSMTELLEELDKNLRELEAANEEAQRGGGGSRHAAGPPVKRTHVATVPFMVNAFNYDKYAGRKDVLVLVDYYASWFEPSKKQSTELGRLARQHGDKVIVLRVNLDKDKNFAQGKGARLNHSKERYLEMKEKAQSNEDSLAQLQYMMKTMGIPDMRILHGGRQLSRLEGSYEYNTLEAMVLQLEPRLPKPKRPTSSGRTTGSPAPAPSIGGLPPGMTRKK